MYRVGRLIQAQREDTQSDNTHREEEEQQRVPVALCRRRNKRKSWCVAEAFRESTGSGRVSLLAVCFVALARKEVLTTKTTSVAKPNRSVDCVTGKQASERARVCSTRRRSSARAEY